jgi:hypothetical protein
MHGPLKSPVSGSAGLSSTFQGLLVRRSIGSCVRSSARSGLRGVVRTDTEWFSWTAQS